MCSPAQGWWFGWQLCWVGRSPCILDQTLIPLNPLNPWLVISKFIPYLDCFCRFQPFSNGWLYPWIPHINDAYWQTPWEVWEVLFRLAELECTGLPLQGLWTQHVRGSQQKPGCNLNQRELRILRISVFPINLTCCAHTTIRWFWRELRSYQEFPIDFFTGLNSEHQSIDQI